MHAHAEVPLIAPTSRGDQFGLIVWRVGNGGTGGFLQRLQPRPGLEEPTPDDRIEHIRMTREIACQRRRCRRDVHHQINQLRVGFEHGEQLHARRKACQKPIQMHDRLIRPCRAGIEPGQDFGAQTVEDFHRAIGPQGGIAGPTRHQIRGLIAQVRRRGGL